MRKDVMATLAGSGAAVEAEGWQDEDAVVRQGRDPAGGVHCGVEDGWGRLIIGCIDAIATLIESFRRFLCEFAALT